MLETLKYRIRRAGMQTGLVAQSKDGASLLAADSLYGTRANPQRYGVVDHAE
jgi:hypothetical protein